MIMGVSCCLVTAVHAPLRLGLPEDGVSHTDAHAGTEQ